MKNLWLNLFWKEWCEHRWRLASLLLIAVSLVALSRLLAPRSWWESTVMFLWMFSGAAGMFVALGVAASENSHKTRSFIESQPLPMWKLGLVKLVMGGLTAALPGVIGVSLLAIEESVRMLLLPGNEQGYQRSMPLPPGFGSYFAFAATTSAAAALSMYLWSAAVAARASNEVRAAAYALGFVLCWFVLITLGTLVVEEQGPWAKEALWPAVSGLATTGPLGFIWAAQRDIPGAPIPGYWLFLLSHCLVAAGFVWRFQRSPSRAVHRHSLSEHASPARSDTFEHWASTQRATFLKERAALQEERPCEAKPAFDNQLAALGWKSLRESIPIVGIGLAPAIGIPTLVLLIQMVRGDAPGVLRPGIGSEMFAPSLLLFGSIVAVVIGIGAVWNDLSPGLHAFWSSRPIRPDHLFWLQYLVGALVLLLVYAAPVEGMFATVLASAPDELAVGWTTAFLLCVFSLAVFFTTVLRHAIYAAILSFGVSISTMLLMTSRGNRVLEDSGSLILLAIAAAATMVAWACFRNNWALRS